MPIRTAFARLLFSFSLGLGAAGGCNGQIGSAPTGPGTGGGSGGGGGTVVTGAAGAGTGGAAGSAPPDPNAAGLLPLRRLTSREYLNTVRDLLADTTSVAADDVPGE